MKIFHFDFKQPFCFFQFFVLFFQKSCLLKEFFILCGYFLFLYLYFLSTVIDNPL